MTDAGAIVWAGAIAAGAAIGASTITGVVSSHIQSTAGQHEDERRKKDNERAIRSAKADRLRKAYVQVLRAANGIEYASKRSGFLLQGETTAERDEEINRVLRESMIGLPEVVARLRLETDTQDVIDPWDGMYRDFVALQTVLDMNRQAPGAVSNILELRQKVGHGLNAIIGAAAKHLAELSQPI